MKKRNFLLVVSALIICLTAIIAVILYKYKHSPLLSDNSYTMADKIDEDMIYIKENAAVKKTAKLHSDQEKLGSKNNNTVSNNKPGTTIDLKDLEGLPLEQKIKTYIGSKIKGFGLVYYDLNSGKSIVINGDKTFTAASTIKVPMNMVLFDMISEGSIDINEKLSYVKSSDYEGGTGILQNNKNNILGSPIPLRILSDYSIIYSDNIATRMIIRRLGRENMKSRFDAKTGHKTNHAGNYITPNDAAAFLKLLYKNPGNNPYYPQLIETMKKTTFHDRIDKYLPYDMVAHKIGNYEGYTNDIGIVFTKNPYVLVIYTENVPGGTEMIAQISKMIYNEQIKQ